MLWLIWIKWIACLCWRNAYSKQTMWQLLNSRCVLFVVVLFARSDKYGIRCMFYDYPLCDKIYRDKYNESLAPLLLTNSDYQGPVMKLAFDPDEFMTVKRLPNENFVHGSNDPDEFLAHDRRDDFSIAFPHGKKLTRKQTYSDHTTRRDNKENLKKSKVIEDSKKKNGTKISDKKKKFVKSRQTNATTTRVKSSLGWALFTCVLARRVIGGSTAESAEKLPYMVFIDTGCGGAIIGSKWVLTAAHCLEEEEPTYVYAGSVELFGGCQHKVEAAFIHPKFSRDRLLSDVGLVQTQPKFVYSPAIKPIPLTKVPARYNMCGVVSGWGTKTHRDGLPSRTLEMALMPIVARYKCRKYRIKRGQFCAGWRGGLIDTCQGDSGGPFVVANEIVGIVSYGEHCAKKYSPGVYVDVFYYRNWISTVSGIC